MKSNDNISNVLFDSWSTLFCWSEIDRKLLLPKNIPPSPPTSGDCSCTIQRAGGSNHMRKSLLRNHQPPLPPNGDRVAGVAVAIFTYTLQQFRLCTVKRSLPKIAEISGFVCMQLEPIVLHKSGMCYISTSLYSSSYVHVLIFFVSLLQVCAFATSIFAYKLAFCNFVQRYSSTVVSMQSQDWLRVLSFLPVDLNDLNQTWSQFDMEITPFSKLS